MAAVNNTGELMMVMMEYQRMMNKEARQDKKIESQSKEVGLNEKQDKLKLDNAKIDQMRKEANEKEDNTMKEATTGLWTGIVTGVSTIAGGFGTTASNENKGSANLSSKSPQKIDSLGVKVKYANPGQQIQKAEQEKKDVEGASRASEDQKKQMKDAIMKLQMQLTAVSKSVKV
ncbi:MAG: hypothetical protein ABJA79_09420 [Parafilimonas sp.]